VRKNASLLVLFAAALVAWLPGCADDSTTVLPARDAVEDVDTAGADLPFADLVKDGAAQDAVEETEGFEVSDVTVPDEGQTADLPGPADAEGSDLPSEAASDVAADVSPAADASADAPADATPCPTTGTLDYTCHAEAPATCPGGLCVAGLCVGPTLDPDRWAECGDGGCTSCESPELCPADCAPAPVLSGKKEYANDTTISVWLHGWSNKGDADLSTMVYGTASGCGGLLEDTLAFGVDRPCFDDPTAPDAPNQLVKIEYWGAIPPGWMSEADAAEIAALPYDEGTGALERYALIAAKAIRHRLDVTGATHVNLACHSFGCLVSRTLIEHDFEHLASEQRVVRWFTSAGVLAGARLSRLYDNPDVQNLGSLLTFNLQDWVVMNPDFVQDKAVVWDHALQGNNPLYRNMLIHHVAGTDPHVKAALGIQLLDLNNPGDEPNDGIMYSFDTFFHAQAPDASLHLPNGQVLPSTHSFVYEYHEYVPDQPGSIALAAAALFHSRKVLITLRSLELKDDREKDSAIDFSENGTAPAEIAMEVEVRYDPYLSTTFGRQVLIAEQRLSDRSPELWTQDEGTSVQPQRRVFEGPVFDDMTELRLDLVVLEVDWYPRFGVLEWAADTDQALAEVHAQVPLVDALVPFETEYARGELKVEVKTLY